MITDTLQAAVFCEAHPSGPLSRMSESAAIVKLFFVPPLHKIAVADTLRATGAEDKPLLRSKLSADSGAKTRLGLGKELSPSGNPDSSGIGIKAINPRGLGTESPENIPPCDELVSSVPLSTTVPLFRQTHVSALNFCMSLFRWSGVSIISQPRWASATAELTRASTKEPAACRAARDKPPAW